MAVLSVIDTNDTRLQEQIEYYRARAHEYEATALPKDALDADSKNPFAQEWQKAIQFARALPRFESILELACGTGLWTRELAQHTDHLTALDAAPEMLELNRASVRNARVRYECVNLFEWEPIQKYDLVFFAAWLSHVPETHLDLFFQRVRRALKANGQIVILDEPRGTKNSLPTMDRMQSRTLNDGRSFRIVKEYYDPKELGVRLKQYGFDSIELERGDYLFWLSAIHPNPGD